MPVNESMIVHVLCLSAVGVIQFAFGSSEGGRKYRSLGRVNYNENLFRCPSEGFHPDAKDCRTFYRCVDSTSNDYFRDYSEPHLTAFRFECGEGTVFDPDYNICNHARDTRRAECRGTGNGGYPSEAYPQNQGSYPSQGEYPGQGQGGQNGYPGQGQGSQGGYPGQGQGSQGGYPGQGVPNENENQIMPAAEGGTNQISVYPSEKCKSAGFHPVRGDCQKFMRCVDNGNGGFTKYEFSCGPGTVWDPVNTVCNYPNQVPGCGGVGGTETGQGASPGQSGRPGEGGSPGQGGYPGPGGMPGEGGIPGQGGSSGQGGSPGQGGYPGQSGRPGQGGYPGSGSSPGQGGVPGDGGRPGQGGYPEQSGYPGGMPGQGGSPGQSGRPGQGDYPGSGSSPEQGVPGEGGQGGYPDQSGYPGGMPGQGGYPGQSGSPGQGGYPGQGGSQVSGYPGSGSSPGQGGRPGQGSYPEQSGYPGGMPGQGGYPGQEGNDKKPEGSPQGEMFPGRCTASGFYGVPGNCKKFIRCVDNGNGGYTKHEFECGSGTAWDIKYNTCNHAFMVEGCKNQMPAEGTGTAGQGGMPGQGAYPSPGGMPGQGGYPGPGGMPGQGGYPGPGGMPGQGGYPGPGGMPGQGGYPGPGGMPGQGGYPGPGGMPEQGGYPGQGGMPGQVGSPGPGVMPGEGGYPGSPTPSYPENSNPESTNPPSGDPSECQNDGFYPVKNNCKAFFRCVNNGKGGFIRYDFQCGEGTAWDQENQVCNYPWAITKNDGKCGSSSANQTWTGQTASPTPSTSSTASQNQYSTSSTPTQAGSQSETPSETTSDSQTPAQGFQTTSSQISNQAPNQFPGSRPTEEGSTRPMMPQPRPTTENPKPETSSIGEDPSKPPAGSSPCDKNTVPSQIKCEKDGFYPDPSDCSKFYRCADWGNKKFSVYYFECGKGTIWDPAIESCNHEKSVYPPRDCSRPNNGTEQRPSTIQSTLSPATGKPNNASTPQEPASSTQSTTTTATQSTTQPPTSTNTTPESNTESSTSAATESQSSTMMPTSQTTTDATETTTSADQTEGTTSSTDSFTEATESTTSMPTSSPSTDSTESSTRPDSSSEMTTSSPTEESTESSTVSQTDSTTSNSEPTEPTESTTLQMTTEASGGRDPNCPQLNDDQSAFVCPTGFRRHPKDCNLFYQCTTSKDTGDINVMVLSCKNDTVYDEQKIQCLPPEETDSCQNRGQGRRYYRRAEDEFSSVVYVSPYKRLCPEEGSFPYEGDCTRFYKCKKSKRGKIQGYLYQCPENYSFNGATGMCEKTSNLPPCTRSIPEVTVRSIKWMKSKVPVEYFNVAFR